MYGVLAKGDFHVALPQGIFVYFCILFVDVSILCSLIQKLRRLVINFPFAPKIKIAVLLNFFAFSSPLLHV